MSEPLNPIRQIGPGYPVTPARRPTRDRNRQDRGAEREQPQHPDAEPGADSGDRESTIDEYV